MANMRIDGVDAHNSIPILIETEKGYVELLLSFIGSDKVENFPPQVRDIAVWVEKMDMWIAPGITGARMIVGPLMDNIPAGDGGEPIDPRLAQLIANESHLDEFLIKYRENVEDDSDLAIIIDGILEKIDKLEEDDL
ncbi:MAG: hypothetical protein M0R50_12395 [Candidatus Cloacimonetes bacterium]|jgi:hypothetical protein|nr:hypothetical protein [Candidatus Cloacimonadota bacterium]